MHGLPCVVATLSERLLSAPPTYVSAAAQALSPACRSSYLFREVWSGGEGLWLGHETGSQEEVHTRINSLGDLRKPFLRLLWPFLCITFSPPPPLLFETSKFKARLGCMRACLRKPKAGRGKAKTVILEYE